MENGRRGTHSVNACTPLPLFPRRIDFIKHEAQQKLKREKFLIMYWHLPQSLAYLNKALCFHVYLVSHRVGQKEEKQRWLPDNYASHSCAVKRGKNTFYNFLWHLLKTLDFGEAIRKRLNMRLDNDIPRDSRQGCLNTTQKQLLLRAGDHFKGFWKKAKSASKCSRMPLGGAG